MGYRVSVVVLKDSHGYYAFSPEIEGCQTTGETLEDVFERTKDTIKQYLEPHAVRPTA